MWKKIRSKLKDYKLTNELYSIRNHKRLMHIKENYKRYGINKKFFETVNRSDFDHIPNELNTFDKDNSRDIMPKMEAFQRFDEQTQKELLNWSDNGYVILRNFFTPELCDEVSNQLREAVESGKVKKKYINKYMNAYSKLPALRKLPFNKRLFEVLEFLLGRKIELTQTINFITGSQQKAHTDFFHSTTYPEGNLIAAWVALEDVDMENGPVFFYPGSHKMPYLYNRDYDNEGTKWKLGSKAYKGYEKFLDDYISEKGIKKEFFTANKGDVLIWHANIIHGGEEVKDPRRTRNSMVMHYFAKDVIRYHEVTQRPSLSEPQFDLFDS